MTHYERKFIEIVWQFYEKQGRHTLPWRKTKNPYRILVSEMMLQQTQVERVVPKYTLFLESFPTVQTLAQSSLADVFKLWQGLGYNRRAKLLHLCAQKIVSSYGGRFPRTYEELLKLPGIGPYTSSALMAFAYNKPTVLIETNVRSVYLHHFFYDVNDVSDSELLPIIERTRSIHASREWYYALMDYGSYLKKTHGNPNKRSLHHNIQSKFEGSDRQIRGAIVRLLSVKSHTRIALHSALTSFEDIRVDAQIEKLLVEGMIVKKATVYSLPQ